MGQNRQQKQPNFAPFALVKRPSGKYQIRFRVGGRQVAISTGETSRKRATALAPEILEKWEKDHTRLIPKSASFPLGQTLPEAIEEYLEAEYAYNKPTTTKAVKRSLTTMTTALEVNRLPQVTPEVFKTSIPLLREGKSVKYWKNILTDCRKFFKWALLNEKIFRDPTIGIKTPPKSQLGKRTTVWTDEDFKTIEKELSPGDREILELLRWTGMDPSDLFELKAKHFIQDENGDWKILKRREKGKSDLETIDQPISSRIRKKVLNQLEKITDPEKRVFEFPYENFKSFGAALSHRVRRVWLRMGLQSKDLKSIRHTFITRHVENNVPVDVLRKWVGHAPDSRVLESVYTHRKSTAKWMD